jgi:hypothetical protein
MPTLPARDQRFLRDDSTNGHSMEPFGLGLSAPGLFFLFVPS